MVSELDTGRCAKEIELRQGWTPSGVPARTLGPEEGGLGSPTSTGEGNECERGRWAPKGGGGWIVRSHIGWGGKRSILYKGVKTSS